MFCPMLLEFIIDEVVWFLYPALRTTAKEDPINHFIVMMSLLPTSLAISWVLQDVAIFIRLVLLGVAKAMTVYGLLGKFDTFTSHALGYSFPAIVLSLYVMSECCFVYGINYYTPLNLSPASSFVAIEMRTLDLATFIQDEVACVYVAAFMKLGVLLSLFLSSSVYHWIFANPDKPPLPLFMDNRYICMVLLIGLVLVVSLDLGCMFYVSTYVSAPFTHGYLPYRIACHVVVVVLMAVLPGRITRRGLAAAEESIHLMREMQHKKTFVRYISHELRSPLSTTSLGLDCLLEVLGRIQVPQELAHTMPIAELLELTQDCKSTTTSAIHTLNDLLLYDKIENKMLQLELEEIRFSGLDFEVSLDPLLPNVILNIDRHKMEQVLRNFMSNAMKFTPAGGRISVAVRVQDSGDGQKPLFRCEVTDTGPGISLFDVNKLQKGGGSGLGLWLSRAIVLEHGGEVGVRSRGLGWGATFFFHIPVFRMAYAEQEGNGKDEEMGEDRAQTDAAEGVENAAESANRSENSSITTSINTSVIITNTSVPADAPAQDNKEEEVLPWREEGALEVHGISVMGSPGKTKGAKGLVPPLHPLAPPQILIPPHAPAPPLLRGREHLVPSAPAATPLRSLGSSSGDHIADTSGVGGGVGTGVGGGLRKVEGLKLHVLIADDAILTRKVVERLLRATTFTLPLPNNTPNPTPQPPPATTHHTPRATHQPTSSSSTNSTNSTPRTKGPDVAADTIEEEVEVEVEVEHASNGQVALDKVKQSLHPWRESTAPIHVVLIDYYMPTLDGVKACMCMRQAGYEGVVIGVTGSNNKEDVSKMKSVGMDEVMLKPLRVQELKKIVQRYFEISASTNSASTSTSNSQGIPQNPTTSATPAATPMASTSTSTTNNNSNPGSIIITPDHTSSPRGGNTDNNNTTASVNASVPASGRLVAEGLRIVRRAIARVRSSSSTHTNSTPPISPYSSFLLPPATPSHAQTQTQTQTQTPSREAGGEVKGVAYREDRDEELEEAVRHAMGMYI
eukprot:gene24241-29312_t